METSGVLTPPSADELMGQAVALAERIRDCALPVDPTVGAVASAVPAPPAGSSDEAGLTWLVPSQTPPEQPREMLPAGPYLYGGNAGIALFLAALARYVPAWRGLAFAALAPVRRHASAVAAGEGPVELGGMVGIGSLIYSLVTLADLLGEPDLLTIARRLSRRITADRLAAPGPLDLMLGTAGALLGLLALDAREAPGGSPHGGAEPLALAELCAEQLLERRRPAGPPDMPRAWQDPGGRTLAGFSHGATGIAYALLLLHRRNGDPRLRAAAVEGFAFERSLFSAERGNWSDRPLPDGGVFMNAWCYGSPGMALGRIASLDAIGALDAIGGIDDPWLRDEIRIALDATVAQRQTTLDHLCCGNLGRVEILRYAAGRLGDASAQAAAGALAARVLRRARTRGRLGLCRTPEDDLFDPSFFKGAAGAGFALLHLASPGPLPEPLLLR